MPYPALEAAARAVAVALVALAGISCGDAASSTDGKPAVFASFYPLEEIARRVGGDRVAVANLTPPGAEPHDLELRPSDIVAVRKAGLVLYFGGDFQPAVERAVRDLPSSRAVDVLTQIRKAEPNDPHVWLSPVLMNDVTGVIAEALGRLVPGSRDEFLQRASAFKDDLSALDGEFKRGLASCARREIVTSHDAFGYLAGAYDLKQVAITGIDPEAEPSSKRLQEVAAEARRTHATTIFFETLVSRRVSDAIARIVGAKTAVLNPLEGLSDAERAAGQDYLSIMRSNLATLRTALGCAP